MIPLKLPKEDKDAMIEELQAHLELDHDITLGRIGAEQLIDYMLHQLSAPVYNQAIEEARKTVIEKMASLEEDIYALKIAKRRSS